MYVNITKANFESEVLKSATPVLVDFWASWCGPCRMIAPFLDQISVEYESRVKIGKVNIEEEEELASMHGINSIPTMIVFQNGKIVNQRTGALPKPEIEKLFKDFV